VIEMVTLFGTTYYTIGTGLVVLVLLAPLLWGFSRWALRPNVEDKPRRTRLLAEGGLTFGLLLLAAIGLYWDVYLIGQRAKALCAETGLVVYRTAKAEGFLGSTAIDAWSQHGFRYVETEYYGKRLRYEMSDGQPAEKHVNELLSKYAIRSLTAAEQDHLDSIDTRITRRSDKVVEISSGQALSELKRVTVDFGWIDRLLINATGFSANPRTCGRTRDGRISVHKDRLNIEDLVLDTLKPEQTR
jgi:hypothetical protein